MTVFSRLNTISTPFAPRLLKALRTWIIKRGFQTGVVKKGGGGGGDGALKGMYGLMWKDERSMIIRPSKWGDYELRDLMYFYSFITVLPLLLIGSYFSIFVGPATLRPISEGYLPKEEEYAKHYISRLFLRYIYPSFQQTYESRLHYIYSEEKNFKRKELLKEIDRVIRENGGTKAFYYNPGYAKYVRKALRVDQSISDSFGSH